MARKTTIPVSMLAAEPVLLAAEHWAPEFNQFVIELCRSAGFVPTVYRGSTESIRAAADLVIQGRCVLCVPASCAFPIQELIWRRLVEPSAYYPWSVLWRGGDRNEYVRSVAECAHWLSEKGNWLDTAEQATG